jgi:predicted Zn-dependent peptidase
MQNFPLIKKTLPGNLRVVLLPRSEVQTVTLMVLIGVGSRYETPRQGGLSHFLEHMFFKGTERRPDKREIAEVLDRVGAEFNAFTGEELTAYYVKVPKEHLALAADVVSDILLRSLFPADEIEREKGVIQEEIRMYTDNPMSHVQHLWLRALFGSHPLGRRIDGTAETVSAFKRRDFLSYTRAHYHTGNTVVAVAGNFEVPVAEKLVQTLFAPLPQGAATTPRQAPAKLFAERFVHERRASLDQSHLLVGVKGVSLRDEERFAADLLAVILGGGMSSRLFMKVREEHGLAYAVRMSSDNYVDTGSLAVQAGLRTDKAALALDLIGQEFDRVIHDPVPPPELAKAKQMVRGQLVMKLEETNALVLFAGGQEQLEGRIETPAEIWEQVAAVTPEDIQKVAQRLLPPGRRAAALLSPHAKVSPFEKLLSRQ